jgi:hypothetical protein
MDNPGESERKTKENWKGTSGEEEQGKLKLLGESGKVCRYVDIQLAEWGNELA